MDPDDIAELWKSIDTDGDGLITREQLRAGLRRRGVPFTANGLNRVMRLFDSDADGSLNYAEFAAFIQLQQHQLRLAWAELDPTDTGRISARDVEQFAMRMNVKLSHAEVARLIATIDRDNCGSVDRAEFTRYFLALTGDLHAEGVFEAWLKESAIGSIQVSDPEGRAKTPTWVLLAAGAIAGMLSRTLTAPMDRLKTLLQASSSPDSALGYSQSSTPVAAMPSGTSSNRKPIHVSGILQGARAIYADGGVTAFWRGNGINTLKVAPETAARFWAYEHFKQLVCADPANITIHERFVAGASAGVFAQAFIYPLEVAKTRFALSTRGHYKNLMHCFRSIVTHEGPRRLYRGMLASLIGIIPYSGTDLTVFSLLKVRRVAGAAAILLAGPARVTTASLSVRRTLMQLAFRTLSLGWGRFLRAVLQQPRADRLSAIPCSWSVRVYRRRGWKVGL
jgi:solute carrier family 25 (mitochondrial phosphate transporter), member 23/24/25/41